MPEVGGRDYSYSPEGVSAAVRDSLRTGKPVQMHRDPNPRNLARMQRLRDYRALRAKAGGPATRTPEARPPEVARFAEGTPAKTATPQQAAASPIRQQWIQRNQQIRGKRGKSRLPGILSSMLRAASPNPAPPAIANANDNARFKRDDVYTAPGTVAPVRGGPLPFDGPAPTYTVDPNNPTRATMNPPMAPTTPPPAPTTPVSPANPGDIYDPATGTWTDPVSKADADAKIRAGYTWVPGGPGKGGYWQPPPSTTPKTGGLVPQTFDQRGRTMGDTNRLSQVMRYRHGTKLSPKENMKKSAEGVAAYIKGAKKP